MGYISAITLYHNLCIFNAKEMCVIHEYSYSTSSILF